MKEQVALISKQDHISMRSKSITDFWEKVNGVMKRIEERAFQLFEERGCQDGHDLDDWFKAEAELLVPVPVKITEEDNKIRILAEIPGFTSNELAYNLEKGLLTIQGTSETQAEKVTEGTKCSESRSRMIYRKLALPVEVVPEKAQATLKNGALEIVVPKAITELAKANASAA
jgi:HSP20 family protein